MLIIIYFQKGPDYPVLKHIKKQTHGSWFNFVEAPMSQFLQKDWYKSVFETVIKFFFS